MAVTDPERKPVRSRKIVGIHLGDGWNMRQAGQLEFNPGRQNRAYNRDTDTDQNGGTNPDAEAAVGWVVHRAMRGVEGSHLLNLRLYSTGQHIYFRQKWLSKSVAA